MVKNIHKKKQSTSLSFSAAGREQDNIPDFGIISVIRSGTGAAWPICLGYLPIGMALGVLAGMALYWLTGMI
jgi:predicted branched-subunit amino acid permease